MSERDPRVDPKPGDILRGGKTDRFVGVITDGGHIGFTYWIFSSGGSGNDCYTSPACWRKWAKTAEVIQRADDGGTR